MSVCPGSKAEGVCGEFKTIQNDGKSVLWRYFCLVVDSNEAVGYIQCKKCKVVTKYDSKQTGNSAPQRHVESLQGGLLPSPSLIAQEKSHSRTNRK